jgi:P-aminobenzoate N-oxygenase AurF
MTATLPAASDPTTRKPRTDCQQLSARLLGSAAEKSYDPAVDIDWTAAVPAGLYGLSPEWSTLYGTPMWASLSEDQLIGGPSELLWKRAGLIRL